MKIKRKDRGSIKLIKILTTNLKLKRIIQMDYEKKGKLKLEKILGKKISEKALSNFDDLDPKIGKLLSFTYGKIYESDILDLKTRQLCTIAALTVLGNYKPHLKTHINGAINVGASQEEIIEVIVQMIAYAGFPAATTALSAALEIFQDKE